MSWSCRFSLSFALEEGRGADAARWPARTQDARRRSRLHVQLYYDESL